MKKKNRKSSKPPTIDQEAVKEDTRITNAFMSPLKNFATIGFELEADLNLTNGYNAMAGYNRLNAIQGIYPQRAVNYTKVLMTKGILPSAEDLTVSLTTNGFAFGWNAVNTSPPAHHSDQVMMVAYFSALNEVRFISGGAERHVGNDVLNLNGIAKGYEAEVYIAFISSDRKCISNSVHLGKLNW